MKRDMDLMRAILIAMEAHPHGFAPQRLAIPGYTGEQIGYHVYLLHDAGLINAADATSFGDPSPQSIPLNLTAKGHDFIASAADESVWKKAKSRALAVSGAVALDVLLALLKDELKSRLGLP